MSVQDKAGEMPTRAEELSPMEILNWRQGQNLSLSLPIGNSPSLSFQIHDYVLESAVPNRNEGPGAIYTAFIAKSKVTFGDD